MVEAELSGAPVPDVTARHGLSPRLVYSGRRIAVTRTGGDLAHLYPVRIADALDAAPPKSSSSASTPSWVGSIEMPGGVVVRVEETVGAHGLMTVPRG